MEKRTLSKLAVASLTLSIASFISITVIILHRYSIVDIEYFGGENYLSIIILITTMALAIGAIPALVLNIAALILIKRNNLRGKVAAVISIIFIIIIVMLYISSVFYDIFIYPSKHAEGHLINSIHGSLKFLPMAESLWRSQDCDGNGIKDYWTYDVSCFHRTYRSDNDTKIAFIPIDVARADMALASMPGDINPFGTPLIESWTNVMTAPKSGYCFMAMVTDEKGILYNQNLVGPNKILATNNSKFAFVTYPDVYACSGVRTFIINEEGTIYCRDMGSDANKIILRWPKPEELKSKWKMLDY